MHIAFNGLIGLIILIYPDDITIFYKKGGDHFAHLGSIFLHCHNYGISLNPAKSIFGVKSAKLLRYKVSSSRIIIDLERVKSIKNMSPPISKNDIQAFMGNINFERRFIPNFSKMFKPIHYTLNYNQNFHWDATIESAFQQINNSISSSPTLKTPNFAKDFIIYTNAAEEAISTILLQKNGEETK